MTAQVGRVGLAELSAVAETPDRDPDRSRERKPEKQAIGNG